jgi:hypothetical protein
VQTAEALGHAVKQSGRGVFLLTWGEKSELARALLVFLAAVDDLPVEAHSIAAPGLPPGLQSALEHRQADESGAAPWPLLLVFLEQTLGRTVGRTLNGWRRGLARESGTVLIVHSSEVSAFCADAPDLGSFLTGRRAQADDFLALWSEETSQKLRLWLTEERLPLPGAVTNLPGDDVDVGELRAWLAHQVDAQPA